ncbi:CoA transferase [Mycobacterium kansasii]|uniref:Succinyl-CoA:(R)-benzylsuccinate CoA-transferase subunit BbsF n=4 Tax=Mycobacterium kansasii TaxID=1768 RepID=A0A653F0L5_MYCKA|nr:CoA transferase [Mycobacterium kansasii]AGZ49849.1 caib/baif family protein [Mycobacterium kansasii ATCC 12478]ARG58263.1 CoA transferase [Mycobacterium kansasii]ARG63777.1 CoA transferase [Mycobacterium kansasii]ARG71422.1 CoA transferase [Mycobacterium kansasii]ARG74063.1 CoA transferase [Mycobacterium kansasii]
MLGSVSQGLGRRPTPLDELRVVEISDRIAGSYCSKLLVDAGARVRKIEPPQGDPLRRYSPSCSPVPDGLPASPLYCYLNAGKQSLTLAPDSERYRAELAAADVVIVTCGRSQAAALGIDPRRLLAESPRAIVVTISDFGWTGPFADRAATEFTLQAWAGSPGFRGDPAGPPLSIGGGLGEYMGGVFAAFGALAVRRRVEHGGPGEHLDLSMLEAMSLMQSSEWLHSQLLRVPPVRRTLEVPSIEPAKDGYVGITMVTGQQWLDFTAMVECPQLEEIPQLRFQIGRWEYRDLIRESIRPWMAERTVEEIVALGQLFRLPIAALGNGATIRDMEYVTERGVFVDNPAGFHQPRPPWLMSRCATAPVCRTAELGADNDESPWCAGESASDPVPVGLPLDGVRVIDLTAFWAGPAATHLLAAFGADVVKVESIQRPDGIRYSGGMRTDVDDWWEYGWVFHAMNTNKRSITLDLGSEDGRRLFLALAADADVVIENFSPRVMEHFGLTAEVLLKANPRLVVARMPAFGLTGPWRDRVGFAPTMEQIGGLTWVTGLPEEPPVTPRGACDPLAGVHAAFAVLAALNFAERSGVGQQVELPMVESVLNTTAIQPIEHEVYGVTLNRCGNRGFGGALQNIYRCAGDDDWIAVSIRDDQDWNALAELMERPSWCDESLSTTALRRERADEIDGRLRDWFAAQSLMPTVESLAASGIPAAPVVSPSLVTENPQLCDRGYFEPLVHCRIGQALYPTPPFARLAGQREWLRRPPPTLGEHNEEILRERCGLTDEELARLAASGVIGTRPKGV